MKIPTSGVRYSSNINIEPYYGKGNFFSSLNAARKFSDGRKVYRISLLPTEESVSLGTLYMITTKSKYLKPFEELFPNEEKARKTFGKMKMDGLELQAVTEIFDIKERRSIFEFIFP